MLTCQNVILYHLFDFIHHFLAALRITIYECIGQMGGDLNFKGQVRMDKIGANAEPFVKEISYSVPCGNTHATYVNAIDTCIKNMSDEIAKGLAQYLN